MSRLKYGAGAAGLAALCASTMGQFEGYRPKAYHDSIGIPTVCYGETRGVRMGMTFTKHECDAMLVKRLNEFAAGMEKCIHRQMSDKVYASFLSLDYNIGTGAFCRSSVARLYNAGQGRAACDALMMYDRAGGHVLEGLRNRRNVERAMCLGGL